ncbi:DUF58 domain-containing protein [Vulgatibacter incomptus]|uniref:VWFA domain-containing protein n=1 Tax=Vulgatibacter incomptus TaxID=1391653 RepID=A0A0K1P8Y5_9BACT|nr:DUF58 domain-containing protein [Vulgatibacter incomptus]AKU89985.1 hypothetical protein AKJ08_0372 [Vulgatibacter incomptus]
MISKELISRIRRIEITTRRAVNDTLAGQYSSTFKGRGMAFSEVRPYEPGDEIRTIDWNVTARLQEPHVKVFTEERELTVMLLVDLSRSQDFGTVEKTKGEVAAEVAALLSFSAITNNDRVGAILFTDRIERFIPPKKGRKHVLALISELFTAKPEGRGTDLEGALGFLGKLQRRRTVTFVLSDFQVPGGPGAERALRVASRRHDLVPIAITDPFELALKPLGIVLMEDPEDGRILPVDLRDAKVRKRYREVMEKQAELRARLFRRLDLDHVEIHCGEDYVGPLLRFFHARAKRRSLA